MMKVGGTSDAGHAMARNTATKISTASKNSTKDTFVNKHPIRNIAELVDVEQGVQSVIVGTVIAIQEDESWWYLGCRACHGKVIKSTDYIDLESEIPKKLDGPNDWWFRLQIRVQDETRTMSLSLFNDEVQTMVGRSAYQLCEKYAKIESDGSIPTEITNLIGNNYALKVAIDDYNDNEATSNTVSVITSLDLESQTDENTTPNEKQKTNKRPVEGEPGSESSAGKKKVVEIKVEKDA
nr:replication protein A 70 kDa DNA-binding subunit B [Tanacetum cinerariifolium]